MVIRNILANEMIKSVEDAWFFSKSQFLAIFQFSLSQICPMKMMFEQKLLLFLSEHNVHVVFSNHMFSFYTSFETCPNNKDILEQFPSQRLPKRNQMAFSLSLLYSHTPKVQKFLASEQSNICLSDVMIRSTIFLGYFQVFCPCVQIALIRLNK